MRDRLIELLQSVPTDCEGNRGVGTIADYLLANGVIVPPCKVGEGLYFIPNNRLAFGIVENIIKSHSGLFAYVFELYDGDIVDEWSIPLCDFGKTVFLTREEAEAALKERSKE